MIEKGKVEGRDVTFQRFRCGYYLTHSPSDSPTLRDGVV